MNTRINVSNLNPQVLATVFSTNQHHGVPKDRYHYIRCRGGGEEHYDMTADPNSLTYSSRRF